MEEVETVTHALRWIASREDSPTTYVIIITDSMSLLQKVKSGMGSPDWNVSMVDKAASLFENSCECTALDIPATGVEENDRADIYMQTGGQSNHHKWFASLKLKC